MADYDIGAAFQAIERELIASLRRNLEKYVDQPDYATWQAEQLRALEKFRRENKKLFDPKFRKINREVQRALREAYNAGNTSAIKKILNAIKLGFKAPEPTSDFFVVNSNRLQTLIDATVNDLQVAETAVLRMADDVYRKTIFNAQVYYSSGSGTLRQAIDMATKDFLTRGVACVEYANGARVGIDSYAEMALRTANKRAKLQGETVAREEYGVNTVIVTKRGVACPKCLKYCGKVFYDDVYSDLPVPDEKYPRLSTAIEGGLYHPNCKDSHSTYFEGISTAPRALSRAEIEKANKVYELEQKQRYNERMIRKYKRLEVGSLDPDNQAFYTSKVKQWQMIQRNHIRANGDVLRRDYAREQI